MSTKPRVIVVLNLETHVPDVLKQGRAIVKAMTGNSLFPTPTPAIAKVSADLDALDAAETAAKTRAKGTADARDAALSVVINDLHELKSHVQQVANASGDQAQAAAQSAGMRLKKTAARQKSEFHAKPGAVSGSVVLTAQKAASRASYEWESSSDQKTWIHLATTLQAKTVVSGLIPGSTVYFRSRPITKEGAGDWSQVISHIVT